MSKRGVLLVNVGTPDSPRTPEVRRYLRQFLSDPRVIDIPALPRALLLYGVILPFRPQKSAKAYQKVWRQEGSPLLYFSQQQRAALQEAFASSGSAETVVELGMRYGNPSIERALNALRQANVDHITIVPMYPQYASASTGSALDEVLRVFKTWPAVPAYNVVPPFYDSAGFIDSFVELAAAHLRGFSPDHLVLSYHGLPERQVQATDDTQAHCLKSENCCAAIVTANRNCYRAQCFATSRALVSKLGETFPGLSHTTTFQSRLGRTPWIKPYTDLVLPELVKQGKKRIAVMCPSFVADCLETLEEVAMRAREDFIAAGGEDFLFIPSLNAHPRWTQTLHEMASAQ